MVHVPIYEPTVSNLPGASLTPKPSADAFGAGIGEAQQQLGAKIASVADSLGASLGTQQNEQDAITAKIETANHDARVNQFANEQMLTGDPATATGVPAQVQEFAAKDRAETLQRIPQRYQGQFTAASTQNFLNHDTRVKTWALKQSFDYAGTRVDQAAGQQAGYLLQNPDDLPRAATALRGVVDEMTVPEWKKNEFRERAGLQLMKPVIDGYLARGDTVGAAEALKRMQTELPSLMGIKALPPASSHQSVLSPVDRDNVIKTVWGEARGEGEEGQAAVASVIRNRMVAGRYGGTTGTEVVRAPNQFEPWQREDTRPQMEALKPGDPKYDQIGKIVDGVFAGQTPDNSRGATHFYSPNAQAGLGRNAPAWAKPETKLASIGTHEFYAPEGAVPTLGLKPTPVGNNAIQTGGAILDQGNRPDRYSGKVEMGGVSVDYVSGGGKTPSAPYGTYPITPGFEGPVITRMGGITLNKNEIYDPQLGRNRLGIAIHPGENNSDGCIAIPRAQWPQFKAALTDKINNEGPQFLTIKPDGSAYIHGANEAPEGKQTQVAQAAQANASQTDAAAGFVRANGYMGAADNELHLTPQEKFLYKTHLTNLNGPGGVDNPPDAQNPQGSRSTLYQSVEEHDGKFYNIPTVWNGKKETEKYTKPDGTVMDVPNKTALANVEKIGWDKFPSYKTADEADARYEQMHKFMDKDTGDYFANKAQQSQPGGLTMAGSAGSAAWVGFMRESESRIKGAQGQLDAKTAVIRANTDNDLKSESMAIRDKGELGKLPTLTDDKLKSLYGPERYQQIQQQRQADMDYYAHTSGWEAKPADERAKDLAALNPANAMPGQDYAYRAENYSNALKLSEGIDRKKEAQQKKFTDEAMKVAIDLNEKNQLTPAVVETLRPHVSHGEYQTLVRMIRPEGGKDDPQAIKDLEKNIEIAPEQFSAMASRYLDQGLVKTETFRSFIKENRGSKKDDMPPSPMKSGRDFVRNSLDPGAFGPSSEMFLRAARERGLAEYDAWAEANPEAKRSEAISTAEDVVKRHSIIATNQMSIAVGASPYFGNKPRDSVTSQDVQDARGNLAADIKAGKITPNQAQIYINQLDSWEQITAAREQLKAPATGGSRGRR